MKTIPAIKLPIINNGEISKHVLSEITANKKIIIFGVPGAFTSTCSNKHFPSYMKFYDDIINKGISSIYCLSVNDPSVMKAWQSQYNEGSKIIMIADGNADLTKSLELDKDYTPSFMGLRSKRFSLLSENNKISIINIEEPGEYKISSAEYIINQI